MTFTSEQLKDLKAPLAHEHVSQRKQAGFNLSYIEGWHAIAEANRIFGYHGWMRQTDRMDCVHEGTYKGKSGEMQTVTYIAQVTITVYTEGPFPIVRMGTGAGHGKSKDRGDAHESASKEAETDAMKRALMTFGNQFGLALYDKRQRNVTKEGDKFKGPMTKTALGAALKLLVADIAACEDEDQLIVLLESQQEIIDQCKMDAPTWWASYKTGTGEDVIGLDERIQLARKRVTENQT